ncbi:MAG: hypothetical protein JWM85_1316 [Acidimicrobiaceae bacterium]|nr:hypothetical protein [Acidimicrobiaceae bacterium]
MGQPRSFAERRDAALAKLEETDADCWVATTFEGRSHLVPLSFSWHDGRILLATARRP